MLVALSPNYKGSYSASPGACGPNWDTADAICRQYVVPPGAPPASAGLVGATFSFYFDPSPPACDNAMTGIVVIQGVLSSAGAGSPYTFVAVVAGNYSCRRSTLGIMGQNNVVFVPPGDYLLSAQSSVGGGATCRHGLNNNGADVTFNGNGDANYTNILQGKCDMDEQ